MADQPDNSAPVLPPPVAPSRNLAGLEEAMRITDEATPFNVVSVLRIDGDLPVASLRTALDALQQRHRLLRSRILPAGKAHAFHFDVTGPIPLEVCERPGRDGWIAEAQNELHRRFDLTTGPLMRCRYLADKHGGDMIVTLHHTIVDATSAVPLFGELLTLCAGQTPASDGDVLLEGTRPASALYPPEFKGLGFVRAVAAYMGRQMADELKFRWRSRGVRKAPIFETGRCCILPIRFPAPLTTALIQASRQHRITLNAILGAGMIAAVQRKLYPSPRVPLRHIVFADFRSRLRTTVSDSMLGCFLTMIRFTVLVERDGGFWHLARQIQDSTVRAARSGERLLAYSMSPGMMKMIFKTKAFRMGATALSYTGPLHLPAETGTFEVTGLHAFASNMTLGPEYSALVRLYRGELWWDILYLDSDMDAAGAQQIADEMRTILESATC